jgi:hypothetical protein
MDPKEKLHELDERLRSVELETSRNSEALKFIRDIVIKIDHDNEATKKKTEEIYKDLHNGLLEEKIGPILDSRYAQKTRKYLFRITTGIIISLVVYLVTNWLL